MLHLAGTVRLPSPTPAAGSIWTVASGKKGKVRAEEMVLRIVHRVSTRLCIERLVRMSDVRAIHATFPAMGDRPAERDYRTYEQFQEAATEFARAHAEQDALWLHEAVAYVSEM